MNYPREVRCIKNTGVVASFKNNKEITFDLTVGNIYTIVGEETDEYGRFYKIDGNDSDEPGYYYPEMFEEI